MSFKANIDNFAKPNREDVDAQDDEMDDEDVLRKGGDDEDEEEAGSKKDGIYRPPKLAPAYNG